MVSTEFHFTDDQAVTPGETWHLRFPVYVGDLDTLESSFSGYDLWSFYLLKSIDVAGVTPAERAAAAYITLAVGSGLDVGTPPNVDATADDTAEVPIGRRSFELWCEINGEPKRVSWGTILVRS